MIQACYSSTNVLGEVEWHGVLVTEDKFQYLTEDPDLAPQRAEQGKAEGWVNVLGL
jgi:hypothetical protein